MPEKDLINGNVEDCVVNASDNEVINIEIENNSELESDNNNDANNTEEFYTKGEVNTTNSADATDLDVIKSCDSKDETNVDVVEEEVDNVTTTKEPNCEEEAVEHVVAQEENVNENVVDVVPVEHVSITKQKKSEFRRHQKIRRVIYGIALTIVWAIGLCALYLCFSNLYQQIFNPGGQTGFFGIGEAIVASNSMEPKLCPNDLIFYKETDVNEISVGDTIVYKKTDANGNNMLIVHDVVQIGDGYVTTQGVNNAAPDEAFPISAIVGKYIFKIGKIGAILNLLSTQWAPVVIISTMLMIFAIRIIVYYVHKKRIVADISNNAKTRKALNHFFDI